MSSCQDCKDREKDWEGSDPVCAFQRGEFDGDNWNCALANRVRSLCTDYTWAEDEYYCCLPILGVCAEDAFVNVPLCLFVNWYKNRGRTQAMWLMFDDEPPRVPSTTEVVAIVECYERSQEGH